MSDEKNEFGQNAGINAGRSEENDIKKEENGFVKDLDALEAEREKLENEAAAARARAEAARARAEAQAEQERIRLEQERNARAGGYSEIYGAESRQTYFDPRIQTGAYRGYSPYAQQNAQPYSQPGQYYYGTPQIPVRQSASPEPIFKKEEEAPVKKKEGKRSGGIIAVCIVAALVFGLLGGFGGNFIFGKINGNASEHTQIPGTTVIYESVDRDASKGAKEKGSVAAVAEIAAPSVVEIRTEATVSSQWYGQYVTQGAGSGVVITADGYIVTNNHVIAGATNINVTLSNGTKYTATLRGTDPTNDVAVIKIDATDLTPAILGSSASLVVGESAIAIGNPLGELGGTVTDGIISALERQVTVEGEKMTLLQTNAAVSPGNSGGGLFNSKGELIGIVNSKSIGSGAEGLGFAIPIDTAKPIIEELIKNGKVTGRPSIGISVKEITTDYDRYRYNVSEYGIYIDSFTNGEFQRGDRIIAVEGNSVSTLSDVRSVLSGFKVGDRITVTVKRNNKLVDVPVTLIESE